MAQFDLEGLFRPGMLLPFLTVAIYLIVDKLKPLLSRVMADDLRRDLQPWIAALLGLVLALLFNYLTGGASEWQLVAVIGFLFGLGASVVDAGVKAIKKAGK